MRRWLPFRSASDECIRILRRSPNRRTISRRGTSRFCGRRRGGTACRRRPARVGPAASSLVDTDGDIESLIPQFLDAGLTGLYPIDFRCSSVRPAGRRRASAGARTAARRRGRRTTRVPPRATTRSMVARPVGAWAKRSWTAPRSRTVHMQDSQRTLNEPTYRVQTAHRPVLNEKRVLRDEQPRGDLLGAGRENQTPHSGDSRDLCATSTSRLLLRVGQRGLRVARPQQDLSGRAESHGVSPPNAIQETPRFPEKMIGRSSLVKRHPKGTTCRVF